MLKFRINGIKIEVSEKEKILLEKKLHTFLKLSEAYTYKIVKKSLDARNKQDLKHIYTIEVTVPNISTLPKNLVNKNNIMLTNERPYQFPTSVLERKNRKTLLPPIVIGAGPAGYFSALYLARAGYCPILFERGKSVEERAKDVETFWKEGKLSKNSNVSFGEGGAGTFSDGKLNTGIKDKKGRIQAVISDFIMYGAPKEIAYLNKPHIGTDELKTVLSHMRQEILSCGGKIYFEHQLVDIQKGSSSNLVLQIEDHTKNKALEVITSACVLAIGHSARDTFTILAKKGSVLPMEMKSFAIGLRIEHKRQTIDAGQYGTSEQAKLLPAADYKMTYRASNDRSVYSFCMCPGGYVVNASSDENQTVVNGMSNHARNEKNSNSAIVVNVTPEDFISEGFGQYGVLAGMEFQKKYEALAYKEGNGKIPVQRFEDYCNGEISDHFGIITPNLKGSYSFGNLNNCLPPYVNDAIIEGVCSYDEKLHGFKDKDAILSGVETRTSSPIRIIRNDSFMSDLEGLFPCGEGAGYAGGITSAAVDGIKVAEAVAFYLNEN